MPCRGDDACVEENEDKYRDHAEHHVHHTQAGGHNLHHLLSGS